MNNHVCALCDNTMITPDGQLICLYMVLLSDGEKSGNVDCVGGTRCPYWKEYRG